jgi:hypothetical protein
MGRNNFISPWQIVIAIRQYRSLYGHTVLSSTAWISIAITEIAVNVMS